MNWLTYESLATTLRLLPGFDLVYDAHVADNGEVLPHVMLGDLSRFLLNEAELLGADSAALEPAMVLMERAMGSSDARLQELVTVSFLEHLEPGDPGFAIIAALFGPHLQQQYLLMTGSDAR